MKILIVDDQQLNKLILKNMLVQKGYDVFVASDGIDALEMFPTVMPDLVLLDVMMPRLDGYETAPRLKKLAGELYLPVIFITALEDKSSLARCLEVGGDDFLTKPFEQALLLAKVRAHLRIRELSCKSAEQTRKLAYYRAQTEREHQIVEHILANALERPESLPRNVEALVKPATVFSGDIFLCATGPVGNTCIFLGDFTGHGLAAAIGTLPVARIFYSMIDKGFHVSDIAQELNEKLYELLPVDMFCASVILEINKFGNRCTVWSGGFPDCYILDNEKQINTIIKSQHLALGILPTSAFEKEVIDLTMQLNDRIILATDGVIEVANSRGEILGEPRWERLLSLLPSLTPNEEEQELGIRQLCSALDSFSVDTEQRDDLSMVVARCVPSPVPILELVESQTAAIVPFTMTFDYSIHDLKRDEPINALVNIISGIHALEAHRTPIFLILSELFNNALEHGLLKLSSSLKQSDSGLETYYEMRSARLKMLEEGNINVKVTLDNKSMLAIKLTDSGSGFDTRQLPLSEAGEISSSIEATLEENEKLYNRGIALVRSLCDSVIYSEKGNEVSVYYRL